MRVLEASEIICGELINTPAIGSFEGFATKVEDVKRGVLFFALDSDDIDTALEKGAFGVVFDSSIQMRNVEIAWIKVDNIQSCISRLVRYLLISKKIEIILLDEIQYIIAKQIIRAKEVLFFDEYRGGFISASNSINNSMRFSVCELLDEIVQQNPTKIITSLEGIADLSIEEYTTCANPQHLPFDIITPHQIFESKFYHKISAYQIPLPAVFLPELAAVVEQLCLREGEEIAFDMSDFAPIEKLLPIALSPEARILPLGKSNKVVISTNSVDIFLRYVRYLKENARYGELAFFVPRILDDKGKEVFTPIHCGEDSSEYGGESSALQSHCRVGFCVEYDMGGAQSEVASQNLHDKKSEDKQNNAQNNASDKLEAICYDSSNELPKLLKLSRFNFALVLGISTEGLIFVLNEASKDTSPVLF